MLRQMFKESPHKAECVMLLLARRRHVDKPKDAIVAAEHRHKPGVRKELCACLLTALIRSCKRVITAVEDRVWQPEVWLDDIAIRWSGTRLIVPVPQTVHLSLHGTNLILWDEDRIGVSARYVTRACRALPTLLRETCVQTNNNVWATQNQYNTCGKRTRRHLHPVPLTVQRGAEAQWTPFT